MRLRSYYRSSASWRVRIALHYKNLEFDYVPVHLLRGGGEQHSESHRTLNPMEQVPLLEVEDEGRNVVLLQSLAIIEYLEERFPEPTLFPGDRVARAVARGYAEIVNSGIQPHQNTGPLADVRGLGGDARAWADKYISIGLSALEVLAARTAGRFLVGDSPSIADVCLVPQLYNARRFGVDLGAFPTLRRVEQSSTALEPFQRAHPERQPDFEPGA
jgi:maleylpyruvate isomerase